MPTHPMSSYGGFDRALNLIEFTHVLENYGFGDDAHHVFAELDADGNGTVKFSEVLDRIRQQQQNLSADASKLLLLFFICLVCLN